MPTQALARLFGGRQAGCLMQTTTMRELMVLYGLAEVLVTNDSGPGQFAPLRPIRSVILFGPETPHLFGPLGDGARVIWKAIPCSPCVSAHNNRHSTCRNNVCMQRIGVAEVLEAVCGLLDGA